MVTCVFDTLVAIVKVLPLHIPLVGGVTARKFSIGLHHEQVFADAVVLVAPTCFGVRVADFLLFIFCLRVPLGNFVSIFLGVLAQLY
jgi:hypothetical protein